MKSDGLLTTQSIYTFDQTVERIERVLLDNNITIFAKIDHSENAERVDLNLRNTTVFLFGAPHIGTLLMQDNQCIGIDLPSKVLTWEDANRKVWVSRNQTSWLIQRHKMEGNLTSESLEEKINRLLDEATAK